MDVLKSYEVCLQGQILSCSACRLMQEITALKSAAFMGGSEATQHDLSNLVDILTACISALHEQRHTTLISELFSVPLWEAMRVSSLNQLS